MVPEVSAIPSEAVFDHTNDSVATPPPASVTARVIKLDPYTPLFVTSTVRLEPDPPKTTFETGTAAAFELESTERTRFATGVSVSPRVIFNVGVVPVKQVL